MNVERLAVAVLSILCGILFLRFARAASQPECAQADDERERITALPRYVIACVAFGTACAVLAHIVAPAVGYAILCLSLVMRAVADLISEERAPRRRAALLRRSRRVDPVLIMWIALAASSALVLTPYVLDQKDRLTAAVVVGCVVAMAAVAWRIASAPPILFGNDLEAEQVDDRQTRAIRTGLTCTLAVGTVFVFTCFVSGSPNIAYGHTASVVTLVVWAGIWVWQSVYANRLSRKAVGP